jgi:hypothetical protein
LHHKSRDAADLVCSKATIGHEHHRLQLELGRVPLTLHVVESEIAFCANFSSL